MEDGVNIDRCRKAAGKAVAKASVFCLVSMACISALVHCKLLVAVSLEKPESMERQGDVAAMIGGWRAKRPISSSLRTKRHQKALWNAKSRKAFQKRKRRPSGIHGQQWEKD